MYLHLQAVCEFADAKYFVAMEVRDLCDTARRVFRPRHQHRVFVLIITATVIIYSDMEKARQILQDIFKFPDCRAAQREVSACCILGGQGCNSCLYGEFFA